MSNEGSGKFHTLPLPPSIEQRVQRLETEIALLHKRVTITENYTEKLYADIKFLYEDKLKELKGIPEES